MTHANMAQTLTGGTKHRMCQNPTASARLLCRSFYPTFPPPFHYRRCRRTAPQLKRDSIGHFIWTIYNKFKQNSGRMPWSGQIHTPAQSFFFAFPTLSHSSQREWGNCVAFNSCWKTLVGWQRKKYWTSQVPFSTGAIIKRKHIDRDDKICRFKSVILLGLGGSQRQRWWGPKTTIRVWECANWGTFFSFCFEECENLLTWA